MALRLIARRTFSARPVPPTIHNTPSPRDFPHAVAGRADVTLDRVAEESQSASGSSRNEGHAGPFTVSISLPCHAGAVGLNSETAKGLAAGTPGNKPLMQNPPVNAAPESAKTAPATFPVRPTSAPGGEGPRGVAGGVKSPVNFQKVVCMTCKTHMRGPIVGPVSHSICPACKADYTIKMRELAKA